MNKPMNDAIRDNAFLFAIVTAGAAILAMGYIPSYHDMLVALGAAFIIAGAVGIYMMLATRQVAKKLHERFNEQNDILISHTEILKRLDKNSSRQTDILSEMASSQKEIVSSQKEIVSSQKDMTEILKRIEDKL